jgi:hypothetical protein
MFMVSTYLVKEVFKLLLALGDDVLDLGDQTRMSVGGRSSLDGVGNLSKGALPISQHSPEHESIRTETTDEIWPKTFLAVSVAFSEVVVPATGRPVAGSTSRGWAAGPVPFSSACVSPLLPAHTRGTYLDFLYNLLRLDGRSVGIWLGGGLNLLHNLLISTRHGISNNSNGNNIQEGWSP